MAGYLLVNWTQDTVEELAVDDFIGAFIQGVEVGQSGDHVAIYATGPLSKLFPVPEEPPPEEMHHDMSEDMPHAPLRA